MKALVLSSGGLDSTTCLGIAVNKWGAENVSTLSIFYGQRNSRELKAAIDVANYYGVARYELDAAGIFKNSRSALLDTSTESLEKGSYSAQKKKNHSPKISTYVPFRNGLMISMAASFADSLYENAYADCSAKFIASMSAAVRIGTYEKIRLIAPFLCQKKADVVKVGLELGVPYHLTWSCYERGDIPCGKCATCIDRAKAFELNGVKDPRNNE